MRRAALVATLFLVIAGYVGFAIRLRHRSDEIRDLRTQVTRKERASDATLNVLKSPRPLDLISVITNGHNVWDHTHTYWPPCSGSNSICVDRVFAPCEEVELAYSYGHMSGHVRFKALRVKQGAMVDHEGKVLGPRDILDLAKQQHAKFENAEWTLEAGLRGDRTRLVGAYTERDEIDVFVPAAIGLDYAKCTDRESRLEVLEFDEQ